MNELEAILRMLQTPTAKMLQRAAKEALVNHIIPYYREQMFRPGQPLSPEEQTRRAQEEFVDVSGDFDIQGEANSAGQTEGKK